MSGRVRERNVAGSVMMEQSTMSAVF